MDRDVASSPAGGCRLLDEDADLAELLPASERQIAAEAITTATIQVGTGDWHPVEDLDAPPAGEGHLGFLVLDGLLIRNVDLHGAACAELLGAGDLLRPFSDVLLDERTLVSQASWRVVEPVRAAVLDREATAAIGRWPELVSALMDRLMHRAHGLAFHLAICGIARLEVRLLAVLWNLADRWGKVRPGSVLLPLQVTHEVLAELVGARRPSVSAAMGRLRDRELVTRDDRAGWVLHGAPPEELDEIRRQLADRLA